MVEKRDPEQLLEYAEAASERLDRAHRFLERTVELLKGAEHRMRRLDVDVDDFGDWNEAGNELSTRVTRIAEAVEQALNRVENYAADLEEQARSSRP